jgi:4-amino-4-deoxy-L-arabinose transferase-like glycosyltransferase
VDKYSLGATVYLQVLPYLLFGKSILVTRMTAVLAATLGAVAVGLLLRDLFGYPHGWAGVLLLGLSPAWFIHARTAFETAVAVAFYGVFLYSYLRYLYGSPNYIPLAGIAAALTFYSYNPARIVILATLGFLVVVDLRTHWANRRLLFRNAWLVLLIVPYLRFQSAHPFAEIDHLYLLNSYWVQPISLLSKIRIFLQEYLRGLSPLYWYLPHTQDLVRHVMRGYGHIFWITFPFALLGLFHSLKNIRQPGYRAVLVALGCAPLGGALVETFVTRSLFFLIPATLLTGIGLALTHAWLAERLKVGWALPVGLFVVLAAGNFFLLRSALLDGPTWFEDYGLYGMQYGAAQVFGEVAKEAAQDPDREFVISPHWTHGLSMLVRFFLEDPVPVVWGVVDDYLEFDYPLDEASVYVMLPDEYNRARESPQIAGIEVEQIIWYPNGQPGFYFAKIRTVNP